MKAQKRHTQSLNSLSPDFLQMFHSFARIIFRVEIFKCVTQTLTFSLGGNYGVLMLVLNSFPVIKMHGRLIECVIESYC